MFNVGSKKNRNWNGRILNNKGNRTMDRMAKFFQYLKRKYQSSRYSKTMKQFRSHLFFFGCDTSHLTDEDIEKGIQAAVNIIANTDVTVDEAVTVLRIYGFYAREGNL